MEKKIEDYLHLYKGCETTYGTFVGLWEGSYYIKRKNGSVERLIINEFKPLLYPLSSLKRKDKKNITSVIGQALYSSEQFKYLLSHHFDLFGLIDAGLAIDISKLK